MKILKFILFLNGFICWCFVKIAGKMDENLGLK